MDVVLNVLLFIPFGFGLRLAGWPWRRVGAAAALVSLTVETLQYFVIIGRDASLGDVLSDTAGGVVGAGLVPYCRALVAPSSVLAWRLLLLWAVIWIGMLAASAWLQAPGARTRHLTSRWAHHAPEPYPFGGQVSSASVDGAAMPLRGPPPDYEALAERLKSGRTTVALEATSGPPTLGRHWLYMISSGRIPQLSVTQKGRNAIIMVPARASRFKLRPPAVSLPDGLPSHAGLPVSLRGGRRGDTLWLETSYAGERHAVELTLSPAHGWAMIAPFDFPLGPAVGLLTGAWIALWTLPLGYWGARVGRPSPAISLVATTLAVGLGVVPALGGHAPVQWSEWLTAALSAAAGWALPRPAAYLQPRCGSPSISVSSSS